jgi:hypothetical protein
MLVVPEVRLGVRGRTRFGVRIASRPNAGRAPPTIASRWSPLPALRGGIGDSSGAVALRAFRLALRDPHPPRFAFGGPARRSKHATGMFSFAARITPRPRKGEGWCPILHASLFGDAGRQRPEDRGPAAPRCEASRDPPVGASRRRRMTMGVAGLVRDSATTPRSRGAFASEVWFYSFPVAPVGAPSSLVSFPNGRSRRGGGRSFECLPTIVMWRPIERPPWRFRYPAARSFAPRAQPELPARPLLRADGSARRTLSLT